MPSALYVGMQDDNKICVFSIDAASGGLTAAGEVPVPGAPSVLAFSGDRRLLYIGRRDDPAISTYRIDQNTGGLTLMGSAPVPAAPTYATPDRSGRYMLAAYYQGGFAAVHALGADGTVGALVCRLDTATGAHAIMSDPSNHFAFVPHIAYIQDNVLEPPKNNPGPNVILQFRFDASTGQLTPNSPARVEQGPLIGPRHYTFHPAHDDLVYFSNEQGSSVSVYRMDKTAGTLSPVQTISTLPAGFSQRNTCSQIHFTPSGRLLYVGNRGHTSIAGFTVDAATGRLAPAGHTPTEPVPSGFCLDPDGKFLFAAGTATGKLASYRINPDSGALTPLGTQAIGQRPASALAVRLGS